MADRFRNPTLPAAAGVSGFQEPGGWPARRPIVGVSGTVRPAGWPAAPSGFQEPQGSGFQEPGPSGYREPHCTGDQEPQLTVYSEPSFVVTGTEWRGIRNRPRRKSVKFQSLVSLSTALNALTLIYNRVSSNGAPSPNHTQDTASWGLRPRRLASPLRGYAPGANAPSHPASPNRRRATPDKLFLSPLVPMVFELENRRGRPHRRKGLSEESLAFSAENPRNRRWAASTPNGGALAR